jgi:predicted AAA+ superfamily ATPase
MDYKKRIIDQDLDLRTQAFGAIQIVGPKGCGKTRTAKERCRSVIAFEDEDHRDSYLKLTASEPSAFFAFPKPILFDEWQDAPKIWGAVRQSCDDHEDEHGVYFLTGSTSKKVVTPHTGTQRISTVEMQPMSLYETGESSGTVSLRKLFDGAESVAGKESPLTVQSLFYATSRGGWPKTLTIANPLAKLLIAKDAYEQIYSKDISAIDGVERNPEIAKAILKSYARNIGTLCKRSILYQDAASYYPLSEPTFDDYVEKLKELFVIKDVDAWCPQIRSEKSLRAPKKHLFVDPSIAIAALGLSPDYFLHDFDLFGHIFEALVYRDLLVYSSALGGSFAHYHDRFNLEVDGVLHLEDGRYALTEIKLGSKEIEDGVNNLLALKELIQKANAEKKGLPIREPDLLLVITGGKLAYEEKGVKIIPIGCLKD